MTLVFHFIDLAIKSQKATVTGNNTNHNKDTINNYLPFFNLWLMAKELRKDRFDFEISPLRPSPEFAPPLIVRPLQQDHLTISPAVAGEFTAPARHSFGVVFKVTQHLSLIRVSVAMVMVYYC